MPTMTHNQEPFTVRDALAIVVLGSFVGFTVGGAAAIVGRLSVWLQLVLQ